MAITLVDRSLEDRLEALAARQGVRASKTRMALAVIQAALARCEETGDPEAWRHTPARRQNGQRPSTADQPDRRPTAASPSARPGESPAGAIAP